MVDIVERALSLCNSRVGVREGVLRNALLETAKEAQQLRVRFAIATAALRIAIEDEIRRTTGRQNPSEEQISERLDRLIESINSATSGEFSGEPSQKKEKVG